MIERISLDQLRVLVVVAEAGSFSAAARRLHRAQSAISRSIQLLESTTGLALFERKGRVPVLTEPGHALLADARAALGGAEDFLATASLLQSDRLQILSLAIHFSLPMDWFLGVMADFRQAFPLVRVHLVTGTIGRVLATVAEGSSSVGLTPWPIGVRLPRDRARLERQHVGTAALVAVASAEHPLAALDRAVAEEDLARHTQLCIHDTAPLARPSELGPMSPAAWHVDDFLVRRELLLAGMGWSVMPEYMVRQDLLAGRLRTLRTAGPPPWPLQIPFSLVYNRERSKRPTTAWFLERCLA
jgi:DNA-binding transcriptional LysR family regulator